jgi:hypothetical protein
MDILRPEERLRLMYDDSKLSVSEFYFFVSQLLRFASEWIRESVHDLRVLVQDLEYKHFSPAEKLRRPEASFLPDSPEAQSAAIKCFKQNWAAVLSHHQKLADSLLDQIRKQQDEVDRLREGVSIRLLVAAEIQIMLLLTCTNDRSSQLLLSEKRPSRSNSTITSSSSLWLRSSISL